MIDVGIILFIQLLEFFFAFLIFTKINKIVLIHLIYFFYTSLKNILFDNSFYFFGFILVLVKFIFFSINNNFSQKLFLVQSLIFFELWIFFLFFYLNQKKKNLKMLPRIGLMLEWNSLWENLLIYSLHIQADTWPGIIQHTLTIVVYAHVPLERVE